MIDTAIIGLFFVAYLIGSIPSGFLIARLHGIEDIREHGSGNIGATNVARVLGFKYFFIVFFLDFFKAYAYLSTLYVFDYTQHLLVVAAVGLLLGNAFPLFLQFRGGKGFATMAGVLLALQPALIFYSLLVWLSVLAISRTVGTASIATLLSVALFACMNSSLDTWMSFFLIGLALFGLYLHRNNMRAVYMNVSR